MTLSHCFKIRNLMVAAALVSGLGLVTHVTAQEQRSFLVDLNTKTVTLFGTLGGEGSYFSGINDAGQVVGGSATPEQDTHAFITGHNGVGMRDLGALGGDWSFAYGINDAGQVVGVSETAGGDQHAFITGPDGMGMRDLGTLGSGYTSAAAINEAGQVVGVVTRRLKAIGTPSSPALMGKA